MANHQDRARPGPLLVRAARLGRAQYTPFWQQNELFCDEDVTPTGVAGTYDAELGGGKLTAAAGAFYLPDGVEDYDAADVAPVPAADEDETLGYVFSVQWGRLSQRHDWLIGYSYAHIETFSVNASYAQADWVRFGSGTQTAGTDIEGHEIRLGYALSNRISLLARPYRVEAITTSQDGNRFRLGKDLPLQNVQSRGKR